MTEQGKKREAEEPDEEITSPKRFRRIHYEHPDGDEEFENEIMMEEVHELFESDDVVTNFEDKIPKVDKEELKRLDEEAEVEEDERLIKMGVLIPMNEDEEADQDAYTITAKMVVTWKHRAEKGGWFRRARLVARQYKWSVFTDEAFAPTSAYAIVRLLVQRFLGEASDS